MSRVSIVSGIRFENNGSFGFYAAPRVAMSWMAGRATDNLGATRLRGSVGRGIKEPLFLQSYSPSPSFSATRISKPERSRGFESASSSAWRTTARGVEATYFANHFDNLISLGTVGSEIQFPVRKHRRDPRFGTGALRHALVVAGSASAATIRSSMRKCFAASRSPIFAPGRHCIGGLVIPVRSRRRIHANASCWRWAAFLSASASTRLHFPGVESNEGYATWNASAEIAFARRTGGFLTRDNLADREYMEPLGYRALGRTVRVGIRARFYMARPLAAISWSGGKDSCAAFHRARTDFDIIAAVTMFNEDGSRSRSHGLRPEIRGADRALGLQSITAGAAHGTSYNENSIAR